MNFNVQIENEGEVQKPWLVLVNGLFASLESWEKSVSSLSNHFRVLRYDGRGQGRGPRPLSGYGLDELTADLLSILEENRIEKAFFVGLSNGARVALNLASLHPSKVSGICACDTYASVSPLLKMKLSSWLEANRVGGPSLRFDVATPWIWGETIVKEKPELLAFYRERAGLEKVHVIEGLIKGAMEDKTIDLTQIKCPVLLCVGREDLLTPSFIHEQMCEQLFMATLKIVKGGHASLLEEPTNIEEFILPWAKDQIAQNKLVDSEPIAERI